MNLQIEIEKALAEEDAAEIARVAAWSCDGHESFSHYFVALGYHARFQLWQAARDRRIALEQKSEAAP